MSSYDKIEGAGGGDRPRKQPAFEICKELGFEGIDYFLGYMNSLPFPYRDGDGDPDPDEFTIRAFPEFPPSAPSEASRLGCRGLTGKDMRKYIAAYERTYRHHYEMQDDWEAIRSDPDLERYTWTTPANRTRQYLLANSMPFEVFERAMLCVGDDAFWKDNWRDISGTYGLVYMHWIVEWRVRLGRFNPYVDGELRAAVWRDTWRDVRDEVAAINARDYPNPRSFPERNVAAGDDYTADEAP